MKAFKLKVAFFAAALSILSGISINAQKVSVDELVAKHLDSIGPKDKRDAVKNQLLLGDIQFTFKGDPTTLRGKALILSESGRALWGMNFNSNDYSQDRILFDGKKVSIGRPSPTALRSLLGDFIYNSETILKDGLLSGVMSASWALKDPAAKKAKVSYDGTKTIDGNETFVLEYTPRSGSDLIIKIYLDSKTYRHVRTEYTRVRGASQGASVDSSAGQSGAIYKLVEDFSDFRKMGDLTLPGTYKITYNRSGTAGTAILAKTNRDAEWTFVVTDVGYNRELEANSFSIDN
jgi:hypothetical protein